MLYVWQMGVIVTPLHVYYMVFTSLLLLHEFVCVCVCIISMSMLAVFSCSSIRRRPWGRR